MRSVALLALGAVVLGSAVMPASAIPMTVTYTGDNIIGSWYKNGAGPLPMPLGPNAGNWKLADTYTTDVGWGPHQLFFYVRNSGGPSSGNPAAFLAEVKGAGITGDMLTSVNWEYSVLDPSALPVPSQFNSLPWAAATTYGYNGQAGIIWTTGNGGQPISGISTSAQWIWDQWNFQYLQHSDLLFRGEFNVVPEPTVLGLLGFGLGLAGLLRLRCR